MGTELKGYKKRPWWIKSSSLFFILLPVFALALKLHTYVPTQIYNIQKWLDVISHFQALNWLLIALSWSIAFLIFFVSKFSLILVSILFILILLLNIILVKKLIIWALLFPVIFWLSPFRRPYLNKALRWWEQLPRFWLKEEMDDVLIDNKKARVINLSLSGALIELLEHHLSLSLEQMCTLGLDQHVFTVVVRRVNGHQYGVQFLNLKSADKRKLKSYLRNNKTTVVR